MYLQRIYFDVEVLSNKKCKKNKKVWELHITPIKYLQESHARTGSSIDPTPR
jgi:hypothetical protein